MSIFSHVENFLKNFCPSSAPLLLALSGGPDSLCLFYSLLAYRDREGTPFHIAHVDHSWRHESQMEAQALQSLADNYQVPFHLKTLRPSLLKGNLEAACRNERYAFFATLCEEKDYQAVITGHHRDDQAETIFKRILEGSHWSRWRGLKQESWIGNMRILRPLLAISKKDIQEALEREKVRFFEDPTNHHLRFLRARMRDEIFPRLNREFGKQIQASLIEIGKDAQELSSFFEQRLAHILDHSIRGAMGTYLDLRQCLPESLLEIKYLLRQLCSREGFFLSRQIIEQAAQALRGGRAFQHFVMGERHIWVDRHRVFVVPHPFDRDEQNSQQELRSDKFYFGCWEVEIREIAYSSSSSTTSWKQGWQGTVRSYLPFGNYHLGYIKQVKHKKGDLSILKKRWNQAKMPAFLSSYFPIVWSETGTFYEFLTGRPSDCLKEGEPCLELSLTYTHMN